MFEPIEAPDAHRGPATGHTSEHGTVWQECAKRINDAFAELFSRDPGAEPTTGVTAEFTAYLNARFEQAEAKVAFLEEALSDALFKIDSHKTLLTHIIDQAFVAPALATQADPDAADPEGKPATGGTPDPSTAIQIPPPIAAPAA